MDDDQPTMDQPGGAIPASEPRFEPALPGADVARCPACLSPIRTDQRYCLECGEPLATDELPPIPATPGVLQERGTPLLIAAAVLLVLVGIGLSWVALREPSEDEAAPTTATATDTIITDTVITDTFPTDTVITDTVITDTVITDTVITDTGAAGGDWPIGQTGFAVIIASKDQAQFTEDDAQVIADAATAAGVSSVGVLDSSEFPSLNPGYWAVYSGPYTTKGEATSAAETIRSQGYPEAYAREVAS